MGILIILSIFGETTLPSLVLPGNSLLVLQNLFPSKDGGRPRRSSILDLTITSSKDLADKVEILMTLRETIHLIPEFLILRKTETNQAKCIL